MERIILIGAGALATDIHEHVAGPRQFVAAFVDPPYASTAQFLGLPVLTTWSEASRTATHYALALADVEQRARVRSLAREAGLAPCEPIVSSAANVSPTASLGAGSVVGPFCWVGAHARIGEDCLLMNHIIAGHDCQVGENSVFCPGSNFAGNTRIGPGCFVGSNAVVAPRVSIGGRSYLAAGAACLRDAPESSFLIGNPARRFPRRDGERHDPQSTSGSKSNNKTARA